MYKKTTAVYALKLSKTANDLQLLFFFYICCMSVLGKRFPLCGTSRGFFHFDLFKGYYGGRFSISETGVNGYRVLQAVEIVNLPKANCDFGLCKLNLTIEGMYVIFNPWNCLHVIYLSQIKRS